MKRIRKISGLVSAVLMLLILIGNSGFTYVIHSCHHGKVERLLSSAGVSEETTCGCCEGVSSSCQLHGEAATGFVIRHDSCNHQLERLMVSELIRTEVQDNIHPFLPLTQTIFAFSGSKPEESLRPNTHIFRQYGRSLATLHCQMIS